jgi:hypothetical protein
MKNAYKIVVGKSKRPGQVGRLRHIWEDNIKTDLKEIGCDDVDWI